MLLSISIPTFNRAKYLDLCLSRILSQINTANSENIEVIISDNNSADDTGLVVKKHIALNMSKNIQYYKNDENIGLDGNITQAFRIAKGRFVLVFGDDDILIDGSIDRILQILTSHLNVGIVYIESFAFKGDYFSRIPNTLTNQYWVYKRTIPFFRRVNYYFTYTSGNIINKELLPNSFFIERFLGTNVNLLNWIFTSAFQSQENIYVPDKLIGTKVENTGGYGFCKTFVGNSNLIFDYFIGLGIDKRHFRIINNKMIVKFIPFLINQNKEKPSEFKNENYFEELYPVYKNNYRFWLFTFPIIRMPRFASTNWLFFNRIYSRIDLYLSISFPEIILRLRKHKIVYKLEG